jgi:hypothetical protein
MVSNDSFFAGLFGFLFGAFIVIMLVIAQQEHYYHIPKEDFKCTSVYHKTMRLDDVSCAQYTHKEADK